jgi:hypothetical protein
LTTKTTYIILTALIAAIWLANGLVCKVLNFVPRHEEIVARILGGQYSRLFTVLIGLAEIIMAIWIITKFKSNLNAIVQIAVILTMNTIELLLAQDLLLWGKLNFLFALILTGIIYYNEFVLSRKLKLPTQQ